MLKRIIRYLLARSQVEHMSPKNNSFWMKRIWEDHITRYKFAAQNIKKGEILDIACGDGYGSAFLAKRMTHVTGVDSSAKAIKGAKKRYGKKYKNLTLITDDALKFLERNKTPFDAIISFETIEHLEDYKKVLTLIKKNLKKSGVFIISTPNKLFSDLVAGDTFNSFHIKEFYTKELVKLVTDIFGSEPLIYLQRPIKKNHLLFGAFYNFIFRAESSIVANNKGCEGLDIILIIRR